MKRTLFVGILSGLLLLQIVDVILNEILDRTKNKQDLEQINQLLASLSKVKDCSSFIRKKDEIDSYGSLYIESKEVKEINSSSYFQLNFSIVYKNFLSELAYTNKVVPLKIDQNEECMAFINSVRF